MPLHGLLCNDAVTKAQFPLKKQTNKHKLSIICVNSGMTIKRIVIDWGGLKKSYPGQG